MAQDVGKSHGFGRVSPVTRPSPYSPVQFRGRGPHAPDAPPEPAVGDAKRRRGFLRRAAAGIVLVAVAAGGVAYFALNRTPGQPPARTVVDAAMLAAVGSPDIHLDAKGATPTLRHPGTVRTPFASIC